MPGLPFFKLKLYILCPKTHRTIVSHRATHPVSQVQESPFYYGDTWYGDTVTRCMDCFVESPEHSNL